MSLEQTLRNGLDNIRSGHLTNEAQVKQAVILPILRALGWNDANPSEFVPEYAVGTENGRGSVDYALCRTSPSQLPLIFIETKKLGNVDVAAEGQLFRYAANQGVPFLVLTDGDVWNFYLAMALGTPAERIVYRAELRHEEKLGEYAGFFRRYLEKENVVTGRARGSAEKDKESEANRLTAQKAIPESWQVLLEEPDNTLVDLLTEAAENKSGIRPEPEDVEAFLKGQLGGKSPVVVANPNGPMEPITQSKTKIVGFILEGYKRELGTAISTLAEILKEFQRRDAGFMARFSARTASRKRLLVAQDRDDLYVQPHLRKYALDLENGWWMGTNYSQASIRQRAEHACEVAEVRFDSQLKLVEGELSQS